jgi:hypothetical protein
LRAPLLSIALQRYQCRPDLAERWVDQLIVEPPEVPNFRARNGIRQIRLEWDAPKGPCDRVKVYRGGTFVGDSSAGSVNDTKAPPGPVEYTARAARGGAEGKPSSDVAVCLDEVRNFTFQIKDPKVEITWDLPFPGARVCVFRRTGAPPEIRAGGSGPEPAGADTKLVTEGKSPWIEAAWKQGVVCYQAVVHDGLGLCTPGKSLRVEIVPPPPPPPPPEPPGPAKAEFATVEGRETVRVTWVSSRTPGCQYVVVRRLGTAAPAGVRDGDASMAIAGTSWTDTLAVAPKSGKRYVYGVFASRSGVVSLAPSLAAPVAILSEVASVQIVGTDARAQLRWQPPHGVAEVRVRRGTAPPQGPQAGHPVVVRNNCEAEDDGLAEGQAYYYALFCGFVMPEDHVLAWSHGMIVKHVPSAPPEPARDFKVFPDGAAIRCTWSAPARGSVEVRRSGASLVEGSPRAASGAELDALLARCDGAALRYNGNQADDVRPNEASTFYTPFIRSGSIAVVGPSVECFVCASVFDLEVREASDKAIVLSWKFPEGTQVADVLWRRDTWPAGPEDPMALKASVTQDEYNAKGGLCEITAGIGVGRVYLCVLARHYSPLGRLVHASASDPAARVEVECAAPLELSYEIRPGLLSRTKRKLKLIVQNPRAEFAGVELLAGTEHPVARETGEVVLRVSPAWAPGRRFEEISAFDLADLRSKGWKHCYLRLFPVDPGQDGWCNIRHPEPRAIDL